MSGTVASRPSERVGLRLIVNGAPAGKGVSLTASDAVLAIVADAPVDIGDDVTARLDTGEQVDGKVVRRFAKGFAIRFSSDAAQPAAGRRARRDEREEAGAPGHERRAAMRIQCWSLETTCDTSEGEIRCRVHDVSLAGACIETPAELRIGDSIVLNNTPGSIVRAANGLYGIAFAQGERTADDADDARPEGKGGAALLSFGFTRDAWTRWAS